MDKWTFAQNRCKVLYLAISLAEHNEYITLWNNHNFR
uniref:Uncharacterized protein n=1 Tax=Anguilla anguilla TaxID=7936 RepID=A0A0E9SIU3_ANGAN